MDPKEFGMIDRYIKRQRKEVVLDIGSNVGEFSEYYSSKFTHVHAFEPVSTTFNILEKNMSVYDNVSVYNVAIGDTASSVDITNLKGHSSRNKIHDKSGKRWLEERIEQRKLDQSDWTIETVQQRTIDSYNFENVDLIKIDTEGYVLPIINGMLETIKRCNPFLYIELHEKTNHSDECFSILQDLSYQRQPVDRLNNLFYKGAYG